MLIIDSFLESNKMLEIGLRHFYCFFLFDKNSIFTQKHIVNPHENYFLD